MEKWCEILVKEHETIMTVLQVAGEEVDYIRGEKSCHPDKVEGIVEFLREFADKYHHAKEEKLLFVKMEAKGIPAEGGPIGMMLLEHEQGRAHVRSVAAALARFKSGDTAAALDIAGSLNAFGDLLAGHIYKEDNILYPMAADVFSREESEDLGRAFDSVEKEELPGVQEKYRALARRLAGLDAAMDTAA